MSATRVVGVDLGGTHIRAVLCDEDGNFVRRTHIETLAEEGLEPVLGRIIEAIRYVIEGETSIAGVGVGAPGPIDSGAGVVSTPPNLPGWKDVPLGRIIQERTGVPAFLANDGNAAAMGEFAYGAGRETTHMVYITVSTGVGGGIIIDGKLLEGARGAAGEVGHMVIEPWGAKCPCGGNGHLEALVAGPAIARQAKAAVEQGRRSIIPDIARRTGRSITARSVSMAAMEGDELALELLTTAGRRLGIGLANIAHAFNPQMIVIGGGVSNAGDLLLGPAKQVALEELMPVFKVDLRIVPASLGADAGLYGAAAVALEGLSEALDR